MKAGTGWKTKNEGRDRPEEAGRVKMKAATGQKSKNEGQEKPEEQK